MASELPKAQASPLAIFSLLLAIFLDMLGNMMVFPLLPFLALQMHATSFWIGVMASSFALTQIFGTIALGNVSDVVGRRVVMLVCLGGSGASLVAFSLAANFFELMLFRSLNGFLSGTVGVAQAFIADLSPPEQRTSCMAQAGVAIGLGLVMGPGFGGLLSRYGFAVVALVAAALTFINFAMALGSLPASTSDGKEEVEDAEAEEGDEMSDSPQETLRELLRRDSAVKVLYVCQFFNQMAWGFYSVISPLFLKDVYSIDGQEMGRLFMLSGLSMVAVQGLITKRAVAQLGEKWCLVLGSVTRMLAYLAIVAVYAEWVPLVTTILVVSGDGLVKPCLAAMTTEHTPGHLRGSAMGVLQAIGAFGNFVGPVVSGALYGIRPALPFCIAAAFACICALVAAVGLTLATHVPPRGRVKFGGEDARIPLQPHSKRQIMRKGSVLEGLHLNPLGLPMQLATPDVAGGAWGVGDVRRLKRSCTTPTPGSFRASGEGPIRFGVRATWAAGSSVSGSAGTDGMS